MVALKEQRTLVVSDNFLVQYRCQVSQSIYLEAYQGEGRENSKGPPLRSHRNMCAFVCAYQILLCLASFLAQGETEGTYASCFSPSYIGPPSCDEEVSYIRRYIRA